MWEWKMFLVNIAETTLVQPLSETYMVKLLILIL